MENSITQKFIDLLGPITDERHHFGIKEEKATFSGYDIIAVDEKQKEVVEQLIKEQFGVEKVLWVEMPVGFTEDEKTKFIIKTHKVDDSELENNPGKTCYLYQIVFSHKIYDVGTFIKTPVKDGCTLGPVIYDPTSFTPLRSVVLTFDVSALQDIDSPEEADDLRRKELHKKLDEMLDNPEEYTPEGKRALLLRMAIV